MEKPTFDPGLTQQFTGVLRRSINKDGSFNVFRRGGTWRDFHPYLQMLSMTWPQFFATILGGYLLINVLFALAYFALGPGHLQGADGVSEMDRFTETGGMINFVPEGTKIRFQINNETAIKAGLKISSKLLNLAKPG